MKKYIFILVAVLFACTKENLPNKGKLNPNAMISLRPALTKSVMNVADIVKYTTDISFYNTGISPNSVSRMFSVAQRDIANTRLLMWGTDIITQQGKYCTDFIEGRDIVFRVLTSPTWPAIWDTVAYIPNSIIASARTKIIKEFADSNYTAVYRVFDSAFVFTPITGAQWKALKLAGQN
ncbi:MAG: hypothetical protein WC833_08625 [Bacteroidales bacterium]|jgi:hypothetical protein